MGSYIALARKYRPAQFSDLVGQSAIVRTLMNAIHSKRIHPAYLFTGSRGIGKTSIARIFSKAIRCPNARWENEQLFSCDTCSSCQEIAAGAGMDVIEIDGASNNGVDAVRDIRENIRFMPTSGTTRITIIDEVHMLSTAAFNALLKTLEEPPPHAIFIFATTEPGKIPATILSRCQRFDFKRVTIPQILSRLTAISESEKLTLEPAALPLLARAAEGSMRDALSLLDQVIAYANGPITADAVRESIGLIETKSILDLLRAVLSRNCAQALSHVSTLYQRGTDLRQLTVGIIETLHATILVKVGAEDPSQQGFSNEDREEIKTLASLRELEELELIFQTFHHALDGIAHSTQPKITLDVLVVKCATAEALMSIQQINANDAGDAATASSTEPQPAQKSAPMTNVASSTPSWEAIVESTREANPLLASILEHSSPLKFPGAENALVIGFDGEYYREQLKTGPYMEQLRSICLKHFGKPVTIKIETALQIQKTSMAEIRKTNELAKEENIRNAAINHPLIKEAQSLFGGELGPVEFGSDPDQGGSP